MAIQVIISGSPIDVSKQQLFNLAKGYAITPEKPQWIEFGGGGRVGIRFSGSLCLMCDANSCDATIQGCVDIRARVWAFIRINGIFWDTKSDVFWELSGGGCTNPIKIPRFW